MIKLGHKKVTLEIWITTDSYWPISLFYILPTLYIGGEHYGISINFSWLFFGIGLNIYISSIAKRMKEKFGEDL